MVLLQYYNTVVGSTEYTIDVRRADGWRRQCHVELPLIWEIGGPERPPRTGQLLSHPSRQFNLQSLTHWNWKEVPQKRNAFEIFQGRVHTAIQVCQDSGPEIQPYDLIRTILRQSVQLA